MIRLIVCMRLQPEADVSAFRHYWNGSLLKALHDMIRTGLVDRAVPSLSLGIERNTQVAASFGTLPPFDAIIELYWSSGKTIEEVSGDPGFVGALGAITVELRQFVAVGQSSLTYTEASDPLAGVNRPLDDKKPDGPITDAEDIDGG